MKIFPFWWIEFFYRVSIVEKCEFFVFLADGNACFLYSRKIVRIKWGITLINKRPV